MARAHTKRTPKKPKKLDERVTRLERLLAELVIAVTGVNEGAVREFQWMQDVFTEHQNEVRNGFADTNERVLRLNTQTQNRIIDLRETLLARLDALTTKLDKGGS
jgi:hypothetical protein